MHKYKKGIQIAAYVVIRVKADNQEKLNDHQKVVPQLLKNSTALFLSGTEK